MILILYFVSASSVHCEFEVGIYDRDGNDITCPSLPCTYRNVYAGDYIYCRFIGDTFAGRLQYGWIKEEDDDNEINEKGPNFISFPNEIDHSNRYDITIPILNININIVMYIMYKTVHV